MDYLRWGRLNGWEETSPGADSGFSEDAGSEEPGSETIPSGAEDSSTASLVETARHAYLDQVEQVRSFLAARKEFLYGEWTG